MAQFRTTADLLDLALQSAGETTGGTSAYETQALNYMNRVHMAIVAGGTIPLLKDQVVEIDEVFRWSKAAKPFVFELQPKVDTGTVTFTLGSEAGTFSSGPAASLAGWHIKVDGRDEWFKIASHTAAATAFEIDGAYPDATVTTSFRAVKLDYDIVPDYLVIDSSNNKVQFQEAAGVTQTATLTSGAYTPSELATEVQTQLNTTGGTPVYTVTYSATTRKFTIASDRGGGATFVLVGNGSSAEFSAHKLLGFDDVASTNAASVESTYVLGGIARLIAPLRIHKGASLSGNIYGIDPESFQRDFPFPLIGEGYPDKFAIVGEKSDGTYTVRFNKYPVDKTRVEADHVPVPRDLKDDAASIPLLPRKYADVLQDATAFYILLDKNDDKAQIYANMVSAKLMAMVNQNRGEQQRMGDSFGQLVPRLDNSSSTSRRRLIFGEPT